MYIYLYRIHQCLTHVQVLSYDRRLAPSHPDPVEPAQRNLRSLRLNLEWAIKHQEEQFKMAWVTFVLQRKIEEELVANNMQLADDYGIIIHILHFASSTHAVIKLGLSSYPGILSRNCRLKDYQRELAPMNIGKLKPSVFILHEQRPRLHMDLRVKHGNAHVPGVKSTEIYATKHLQEIFVLLSE